jgi:hypothetical protein
MPQPIPKDLATWQQCVESEQITHRALTQIADDKAFSGSNIPYKSFLQLRAIWPPELNSLGACSKTLQAAGFFTPDDADLAEKLVYGSGLNRWRGLDKLDAFLKRLAKGGTAISLETPPQSSKCSGEDFGAFAVPLQNLCLLFPERKGVPDRVIYTPKIHMNRGFQWFAKEEGEQDLEKISKLDLNKSSVAYMTPLLGSFEEPMSDIEESISDIDIVDGKPPGTLDSPLVQVQYRKTRWHAQALSDRSARTSTAGDDDGTTTETSKADIRGAIEGKDTNPAAQQGPDSPVIPNRTLYNLQPQPCLSRFPPGRTRYEVQTSNFFFSFLSALQAHIFRIFSVPPIVAVPEECRYEFGWLPSDLLTTAASMTTTTTTTTNQPLQQPQRRRRCLYVACPDGAFYRQESWDVKLRFAYFELKPFRRKGANWALIAKDETAEMAAILYQELRISKERCVVLLFIYLSVIFLLTLLAFFYSVYNIFLLLL